MICEHLQELEQAMIADGAREVYRGRPWGQNCREWVYFDGVLDLAGLRKRFALADCVVDHVHRGTHDGCEAGFECTVHHDGIMGVHPEMKREGMRVFGG
jgi:hypothetical protein